MIASIDWLSFTFPTDRKEDYLSHELWGRVETAFSRQLPRTYRLTTADSIFTQRMGRAPYSAALQREDNGMMVFASPRLDNALVELSGIGCDALGGTENELVVLEENLPRLTRVDIAVDILTEVQPNEFVSERSDGRFASWSENLTPTGHTIYIGSRKSDRYCRVYRYFEPHPRSRFLRVEYVLKAEQARAGALSLCDSGVGAVVAKLGNSFGWKHPLWQPEVTTTEKAKSWQPEREQGRTVMWVYAQVLPALLKLHRQNVLDLREVWHNDILPRLDKSQPPRYDNPEHPAQ